MRSEAPEAPTDLGEAAQARWPSLAADVLALTGGANVDFDLLAHLLRTEERLAELRTAIAKQGVTVEGSKGQLRPHPLLLREEALSRSVADAYDTLKLTPARRGQLVNVDPNGRLTRPRRRFS